VSEPADARRRRPHALAALKSGLAATALLAVTLGLIAWHGRHTDSQHNSYVGARSVDVDVSSGDVEVLGGTGTAAVDRTVSWAMLKPVVSEHLDDDRLTVRVICGSAHRWLCSSSVRVVVPEATAVRVHTGAGRISVRDLSGTLALSSGSGAVEGTALRSSRVNAQSSTGSVRLRFSTAPERVLARSDAADVDVALPQGRDYRVAAASPAPNARVDVVNNPLSARLVDVRSRTGSVRVGYGDPSNTLAQ
jgi:hypothetical protein